MKRYTLLIFSFLLVSFAGAQNNNLTVTPLTGSVNAILQQHLTGEGVLMSGCPDPTGSLGLQSGKFNNQTTVNHSQIGIFNRNGFTTFPFVSGLVLTTGNVSVAAGPNDSGGKSIPVTNPYYENDLQPLLQPGQSVNSSASLEFDFVAMADTFEFNYIFGSEEYLEWVGYSYNDVFAFFLTGLDPVTYNETTKNVAIVPGTINTPVSINNVNSTSHSQYYINNPDNIYNPVPGVQYDGYTTALKACAPILGCQIYHMKLAIANVSDPAFDSGVFLEESSFFSPRLTIDTAWQTSEGGDTLIQNCRNLDLTFTLPYPARTGYTEIIINPINTLGNAVLGQDYSLTLSNGTPIDLNSPSFVYEADSTIKRVHVKILPTAQFNPNTPVKTVALEIQTQGCSGTGFMDAFPPFKDTIVVYLRANDSIRLRDTLFTRCEKLDSIRVEQVSGTGPFTYHWIDTVGIVDTLVVSDTANLVTACNITQSRTYKVAASDQWGCMTDTATVQVNIVPRPEFNVTYTPDHGCMPLQVTLQTHYSPDTSKLYWVISSDEEYSYVDSVATIHPSLPVPGYYDIALFVESAPGCNDSLKYNNVIHVSDYPHADFSFGPDEPGNGEEVFFFNNSTGDNITDYAWNFGDGHFSHDEEPTHAYHLTESAFMTVNLTVTNSDGCSDDTIQVVPVEDHFALFVPSGFTPNTDNKNEIFQPKVNDVIDYDFTIYARNGEMIFHTNSPEMGWDGTVRGKPAPEGVYMWKIHYARIGTPDEKEMRMGTVTLIR